MNGGVPSKGLNETLLNILNELAIDRSLLDNYAQHIRFLLGAGANRDTQNRHGKTLSHYLDKRLSDILDQLAIDRNLLDNPDWIQYIRFLLGAGANPNVQNQDGKTLLHYVAERNDIDGIEFLLNVRADPNVQDQSGKTPFEYVTEPNCLKAIKDLGCSSNDKTTCTKLSDPDPDKDQGYHSDSSCENEENPAKSPNNDNRTPTDQQTSSERPVVSDRDSEDEDSSYSSSNYLFLEDSLLAKLGIPLTTSEEGLIDKFCEKIRGITAQDKQESEESILESIEKIVNGYVEKGLRLNSSCSNDNDNGDKETVTSLIFKEMEEVIAQLRVNPRSSTAMLNTHDYTDESDGDEYRADEYKTSDIIIKRITSNLLLKGGMGKKFLYGDTELTNKHYDCDYLNDLNEKCEEIESKLISIAYEGIVNKSKQTHEYDFKAEIDNVYFYVKYPQDSIIEPVKILNNEKAKKLNLKVGILQIGESIVRVEKDADGKRNYKDILKGSIEMSLPLR
ncbi:ANK_REP_REGION domain-containing protein [Trichonephila clavata]|uniref:Ankyrin repeat domain-containing protein 54 n=1 Tax=Trichonephila clavata TaxID=2740835 RepID=A0A8X6LSH8_TRICU|nr:ANK_REP_REGION domain-containing protein [Trichonephila clavata]